LLRSGAIAAALLPVFTQDGGLLQSSASQTGARPAGVKGGLDAPKSGDLLRRN
jgi:hypothetical protein